LLLFFSPKFLAINSPWEDREDVNLDFIGELLGGITLMAEIEEDDALESFCWRFFPCLLLLGFGMSFRKDDDDSKEVPTLLFCGFCASDDFDDASDDFRIKSSHFSNCFLAFFSGFHVPEFTKELAIELVSLVGGLLRDIG